MRGLICTIIFVIFISLSWIKQTDADPKSMDPKSKTVQEDEDYSEETEMMIEILNVCNDSFRIDIEYLEALDDSGSFPDETDKTPKCYVRCMLEKSGVATEKGTYDPKMAAVVFGGERGGKVMNDVEELAMSCTTRDEPCMCERAYQFIKCLMEKQIEEYEKAE